MDAEVIKGEDVIIREGAKLINGKIIIGNHVRINEDCILDGTGTLTIEDNVAIGAGTYIYTHMGHLGKRDFTEPVTLKQGVWILPRVFINPGVTIGAYTRVDNFSLVTRSLPPNVVARGIPARVIRQHKCVNCGHDIGYFQREFFPATESDLQGQERYALKTIVKKDDYVLRHEGNTQDCQQADGVFPCTCIKPEMGV